jgi:hypothetical protein
MINGNDEHAISRQMTELVSAELEYRTIRFALIECENAGVPQNGMVHSFIDRGFLAHQRKRGRGSFWNVEFGKEPPVPSSSGKVA